MHSQQGTLSIIDSTITNTSTSTSGIGTAYSGAVYSSHANVSLVPSGSLQLCGAATLFAANDSAPWVPACAPLLHLYFETWAVGPTVLDELEPDTLTLDFVADGAGRVQRFEAPVEPKVAPLPFARMSVPVVVEGIRGDAAMAA